MWTKLILMQDYRLLHHNQALPDAPHHGFGACRNIEFGEDGGDVKLNGVFRDFHTPRDLFVGESRG
jgi:hypothetical protein